MAYALVDQPPDLDLWGVEGGVRSGSMVSFSASQSSASGSS